MTQIRVESPAATEELWRSGLTFESRVQRWPWNLSAVFILAILYYAAARLGLAFAIPPGNATAVWPPSGIALSAMVILGVRVCPGIWLGSLLVNWGTDLSFLASSAIATGNTLEALIALWLCRHFLNLKAPFQDFSFGFQLFLIAAIACTVAATIGTASLAYGGYIDARQIVVNWSTWWLGDVAGVILITPIFIFLSSRTNWRVDARSLAGICFSLFLLAFVSQCIFIGWLPEGIAEGLLYLPLIIVFFLLLRFHPLVVCLGNLLIATIAVLGTSAGVGPFATEVVTQSLLELQLFMTVYVLAGLAMAGILASQRTAQRRESQLAARVQSEERMRLKETELAHVSRLSTMGEMVAGIAHEINQPLYAISNSAAASEYLIGQSEIENKEQLQILNSQITEQAVRAGAIIRRLRGFIGNTDGTRTTFFLRDAVNDSSLLLNSEAQRMKVSIKVKETGKSLQVHADRVQIEQVLVNLLRNAFDAMSECDPDERVVIVGISEGDSDNWARISVTDNGLGVSKEDQDSLFDAFFTTKKSGMGVGLAISRTIIESHGGRIWAESNPSGGMTFNVTLPQNGEA